MSVVLPFLLRPLLWVVRDFAHRAGKLVLALFANEVRCFLPVEVVQQFRVKFQARQCFVARGAGMSLVLARSETVRFAGRTHQVSMEAVMIPHDFLGPGIFRKDFQTC